MRHDFFMLQAYFMFNSAGTLLRTLCTTYFFVFQKIKMQQNFVLDHLKEVSIKVEALHILDNIFFKFVYLKHLPSCMLKVPSISSLATQDNFHVLIAPRVQRKFLCLQQI